MRGCDNLSGITVSDKNNKYDSRNSCNAIIETTSNCLIQGCYNTVIPNSVTSIGAYSFCECSRLTTINIPNSVTKIGQCSFADCSRLTTINIPNSVTSIGGSAFDGCDRLTTINIPNSVTSIGRAAFFGCDSLATINIPNSVTSIGDNAFSYCSSLTSINIPNSVTSIGNYAFEYCSKLKDVYYSGTKAQWNAITIGSYNECLTNATIHYSSEGPQTSETLISYRYKNDANDSYSFKNFLPNDGFSSKTLELKYWTRIFGKTKGKKFYDTKKGNISGLCYGISTTEMATIAYRRPSVSSYAGWNGPFSYKSASELSDVEKDWKSSVTDLTAEEYIKYAHVSQYSSEVSNMINANTNKYDLLYTAVKDYILNDASPVCIAVFQNGSGHALWPVGIGQNNNERTEIYVIDSNYPKTIRSLYLFKSNGKYNNYTYRIDDKHTWSALDGSISFVYAADYFIKEFYGESSFIYNYCLIIANSIKRNISIDGEILSADSDKFTKIYEIDSETDNSDALEINDNSEKYWADLPDSFTVTTEGENNSYSIATDNNIIDVETTGSGVADFTNMNDEASVTLSCSEEDEFALTYTSVEEEGNLIKIELTGDGTDKVSVIPVDNGIQFDYSPSGNISISGAYTTEDGAEHAYDDISLPANASSIQITENSETISIKADDDGDGVYDVTVAENVGHTHTPVVRDAVAANCTDDGLTEGIGCSTCGEMIVEQETIQAIGHSFTNYICNNDASYTADGTETALCDNGCGETDTRTAARTKKILATAKFKSVTNTASGIKITWSKVKDASGYYLYRKTGSGSYKKIKTLSSSASSYTDTAVKSKNGSQYTYKIKAYNGKVTGKYTTKTIYRLTGISLTSAKNVTSKAITLKWGKNTKASGYQIQYSTSKTFAKNNKSVTVNGYSKVSTTIKKLTKNKTYYVKVRAYKTKGTLKSYSAWSTAKAVKIRK